MAFTLCFIIIASRETSHIASGFLIELRLVNVILRLEIPRTLLVPKERFLMIFKEIFIRYSGKLSAAASWNIYLLK